MRQSEADHCNDGNRQPQRAGKETEFQYFRHKQGKDQWQKGDDDCDHAGHAKLLRFIRVAVWHIKVANNQRRDGECHGADAYKNRCNDGDRDQRNQRGSLYSNMILSGMQVPEFMANPEAFMGFTQSILGFNWDEIFGGGF